MRKLIHFLFGHGGAYIEQHPFRVGTDTTGTISLCRGCGARWWGWKVRYVHDLLVKM